MPTQDRYNANIWNLQLNMIWRFSNVTCIILKKSDQTARGGTAIRIRSNVKHHKIEHFEDDDLKISYIK